MSDTNWEEREVFHQTLIEQGFQKSKNLTCPFCSRHDVMHLAEPIIIIHDDCIEIVPVTHYGCTNCLAIWALR